MAAERPLNNPDTNPNYEKDLAAQRLRAVENRNLAAAIETPNKSPEFQAGVDAMTNKRQAEIMATRPDLQALAANKGVDPTIQQPSAPAPMQRDPAREQKMLDKLGGAPKSAEEFNLMMKATYSPKELTAMGFTPLQASQMSSGGQSGQTASGGAGGSAPAFDPASLKAMGWTDEQIAAMAGKGGDVNAAQDKLNKTPQPTNAMLGTLQAALKLKSGVGNQQTGKSQLFEQAGVQTTGASGYSALAQSLSQRRAEMGQTYDSYANLIQQVGGQMSDTFNNALENYKATMATYDKAIEQVNKVNEENRQFERQLDLMKRQAELSKEAWTYQQEWEQKNKATQPDYQFVSETENQPAGYFNKSTGEFTPLTVGGDPYSSGSSYLGDTTPDAAAPNGASYSYSQPVPHGSANTEVISTNPNLIDIYKNGYQKAAGPNGLGGQCAYEAQQWVDLNGKGWKVGNTIQEKAKSFAKYAEQGLAFYKGQGKPQVGNAVFSNDDPKWGHYWVINSITPEGKYVASEFNRAGNRVFSNNRIVDPNDKSIIGFLKTTPKSQYQVDKETTAATNIKKAVQGVGNIAKGKVQGGLLDLLAASAMLAKDVLVDSGARAKETVQVPTGGMTFGPLGNVVPESKAVSKTQLNSEKTLALDKKTQIEAKAKIDAGIKAGILDESGKPYSPDRMAVRSGAYTDTMLNQKYSELKKAVQKGYESPYALEAFQKDLIYGKQKAQEMSSQQKITDKLAQPMNDSQSTAIGFAVSAQQAEGFMPMNGNDKALASLNNWFARSGKADDIVSDKINEIKDPVAQQIVQAEMQWVANVLRGESGAAIALSEYKDAGRTYFPRPGDSEAILAKKKLAREQKVHNLILKAGPQGAQYWANLGYNIPEAIAKQYGIDQGPRKDSLGLFSENEADSLGLGI